MLEGKLPFDDSNFEFKIEKPSQVELDSQIALMNLRITQDLPFGKDFEEPNQIPATTENSESTEQPSGGEKLAEGFGYYAYKEGEDREGAGVTYVGEWFNFMRHGRGVLRNHREKWEYRGTFACNQIDGFG